MTTARQVVGQADGGGGFLKLLDALVQEAEAIIREGKDKLRVQSLLQLYGNATHDLEQRGDNPKPHITQVTKEKFKGLLSSN